LGILRSLSEQMDSKLGEDANAKLLTKGPMQSKWADPLCRYLSLTESSKDTEILAPLVLKEIHYRLLTSQMGGMLRNLLYVDSKASRVARAILHIRERFKETLTIEQLAHVSSMSSSALHAHFKSVTGTTPMQYQKDLRLIEARNLLMAGERSVSSAALEVGYESPSHFSREYTRKHGCSPKNHLLRAENIA
ncbi:MAG: helix-turn-helix domain-containing protein, partial [Pseudomonadota bacterium]